MTSKSLHSKSTRNGFVTIIALVALIVTLAFSVGMAKSLIAIRDASVGLDSRLQAEVLSTSYFNYALQKHQKDESYTGETIEIQPADWQQSYPAKVTISVEPETGELEVLTLVSTTDGKFHQSLTRKSFSPRS